MPSKKRPYQYPSKTEQNAIDQRDAWEKEITRICKEITWDCLHCKKLNKVGQSTLSVVLSRGYSYSQDDGGTYWYEEKNPDFHLTGKCKCKVAVREIINKELYKFVAHYRYQFIQGKDIIIERGH
jgi:hypothetical protein